MTVRALARHSRSSHINPTTYLRIPPPRSDQLHLTPVRANLQMRPSLSYLDERDAKQKEVQRHTDDEDESAGEEELKAVQVQFKRRESERAQAARKRSHAYLQKQFEEDAWVPLAYHDEQVRGRGRRNRSGCACADLVDPPRTRTAAIAIDAGGGRGVRPALCHRRGPHCPADLEERVSEDAHPATLHRGRVRCGHARPMGGRRTLKKCCVRTDVCWMCRHRQLSSAAGVVSMHDLQNMNLEDRVRTLLQNSTATAPQGHVHCLALS